MKKFLLLVLSAVLFALCLTACGDSSSMTEQDKNSNLKDANTKAKGVFLSLYNKADDLFRGTDTSQLSYSTNGVISVESLKNTSDPLAKAVYDFIDPEWGNGKTEAGYIYIDFDYYELLDNFSVNDTTGGNYNSFVQWSADENGTLIGQYPNPASTYEEAERFSFGRKN